MTSKYDLEKIRKKLQEKQGSKFKDPSEFKPPQVKSDTETLKYRFYVLPPLTEGEKCADGVASRTQEVFYVPNGAHWIHNRSHACPRVHDLEECPVCQIGFDLMSETDNKDRRREIAKQFLPRTQFAVNIYFPKDSVNPEELAGKVMWMNASKQIYDLFEACIMAPDEGDPNDPQAFGVFYDENAAYLFQLEIHKKNQWNDYGKSKFLASIGKRPVAIKDGQPNQARIQQILDQRHDLFTKFQDRDAEALKVLGRQMMSGDVVEEGAGFDEDETKGDTKPQAAKPQAAKPQAQAQSKPQPQHKAESKAEPEAEVMDEGIGQDEVETPAAKTPEAVAQAPTSDVEDAELQNLLEDIEDSE